MLLDYSPQYLNRNITALLLAGTVFSLAQITRLPEVKVWARCSSSNIFLFKDEARLPAQLRAETEDLIQEQLHVLFPCSQMSCDLFPWILVQ